MGQATRRTSQLRIRKPKVVLGTDQRRIIDEAIEALRREPAVYQRGGQLCEIVRDLGTGATLRLNASNSNLRIIPLSQGRLNELLGDNAEWIKLTENGERRCVPPSWVARGVLDREQWAGIRRLEGIVDCPTMRPDGTIIETDGWDEMTGVYAEGLSAFPGVDANPDEAAVERAKADLLELVADFPFEGEEHRAAWLSAVLTPPARSAMTEETSPMFLFDAPTPGSGKSMLADLVVITATAREAARTPYPDCNDEMAKLITSVAVEGHRVILLDNIATPLGGAALDCALTSISWKGRVLGASKTTKNTPLMAVWLATGNNVQLKGDTHRRVVPCRLVPAEERPEERSDFQIPHLITYVRANRARLVVAALTILRAHAASGKGDCGLKAFGSYGEWSRVVRGAVFQATGYDL